jgi:hypothetical protein
MIERRWWRVGLLALGCSAVLSGCYYDPYTGYTYPATVAPYPYPPYPYGYSRPYPPPPPPNPGPGAPPPYNAPVQQAPLPPAQ